MNTPTDNNTFTSFSQVEDVDFASFCNSLQIIQENIVLMNEVKEIVFFNHAFHTKLLQLSDKENIASTLERFKFILSRLNFINLKEQNDNLPQPLEIDPGNRFEARVSSVSINNKIYFLTILNSINYSSLSESFKLLERDQLRMIIDNLPDSIYFKDINHKFVIANTVHACRLKAYSPELMIGKSDYDFFPKPFAQINFDKEEQVLTSGKALLNVEETHINESTGKASFFLVSTIPLRDETNRINGLVSISRNITDFKEMIKELHYKEASLNALIENTRNAIWSIDSDYRIININTFFRESFKTSFGIDLSVGTHALNILAGEERNEWKRIYDRALTGEQWLEEHSYETSGKRIYFEILISPIFNEAREVAGATFLSHNVTERKEYENELVTSRAQLKAILDNVPHLAWLKDNNGKYVMVNKPFSRFYLKRARDIIGKTDFDIFSLQKAKKYEQQDRKIIVDKRQLIFEEEESSDYGLLWNETIKTPVLNTNGVVIGITGISRDITERKELELRIKSNEEHFRSLLQNSNDAITILDKHARITFESSLEGKISKRSFAELKGMHIFELIHPDDRENVQMVFANMIKNPTEKPKVEFRGIQKDGTTLYIESIFANNLANPLIKGVVMNSRDISERKAAYKREEDFKEKLFYLSLTALEFLSISIDEDIFAYIGKKLSELIRDALILVSSFDENKQIFVLKHIAGVDNRLHELGELLNRDPMQMTIKVSDEFKKRLIKQVKELFEYRGGLFEAVNCEVDEVLCEQIQKNFGINKVYGIALMRGGKLYGRTLIGTTKDANLNETKLIETFIYQASIALHRKQLENELVRAKEKAEESDKLKSAFLANMSHEIRTPLNSILGFSQLLNDAHLLPNLRLEYSEIVNANGKILTNLINDIVDISKIEAGQLGLKMEVFSLATLLNEIYGFFEANHDFAEKPNVKLQLVNNCNENLKLVSDPVRIRQVLTNLIGNAIKFTDNGFVEMGCKEISGFVQFYVKDTGIGFSPKKQKVIFDRFTQIDHTSTRRYGGSGLGLAISKGLIELLGGEIYAESELDKGAMFIFTIPYKYIEGQKVTKKEFVKLLKNHTYKWEGKTILVVEDEKLNFRYLYEILKKTNVNVIHAINGLEAIEKTRQNHIDLILMDLQLPEISGYDATIEIRKFSKTLPIIAQTANAMEEDRQRCLDLGFNDYITKPIAIETLYQTIEKYFKKN